MDATDYRECCGTPADAALGMGHADGCPVAAQMAADNLARYTGPTHIHGFVHLDLGGAIGAVERTARRNRITLDVEVLVSPSKGWRPATIAEAWTWHH